MERLYSQGLTRNHQSMKAIGYKEWFDYYDHQIDLNDVLELIKNIQDNTLKDSILGLKTNLMFIGMM